MSEGEDSALDELIKDLQADRATAKNADPRNDRLVMQLTDRLIKLLAMKQKEGEGVKKPRGRGFDLGGGNGQPGTRN